tara:strand:- start:4301 stop:5941 length:1641 start_codon:yes stop_codon:yes gene_type:complete
MARKKRVLFISEASYLNTGYAKYSKEVISRLHKSGKYDVAEMSTYGSAKDSRRSQIPWKNYPLLPDPENKEQVKAYGENANNQFGSWRFERICLDFEPDIVLTIRDYWMDAFVYHSPYRRLFNWCWMPTVDASPQNPEWIDLFCDADYVLTYSDWAKETLEKQAGKNINTVGSAPPSASDAFIPMDKESVRDEFGLRNDINIIGTVMRNQRRKLFPALISAFGKYLKETGDTKTYLYMHTSYPDAGWNLANLIHSSDISSRILMTYVCENPECKNVEVSFFRDAKKVCPRCGEFSSTPSNVSNGVSDDVLAKIYNLFDLYVQPANSEGFGLPQVEAAACGIPIACTNYSAMEDIVNKLNAYPIGYTKYKELETGCDRAVIDEDSLVGIIKTFLLNKKQKSNTRQLFEENYTWDKTAEQWMNIIDDCEFANWKQPARIIRPGQLNPDEKSNERFLQQLTEMFCYYEGHKNSYFSRNLMSDLTKGTTKIAWDDYYSHEFTVANANKQRPVDRQKIVEIFAKRLQNYNLWEDVRINRHRLQDGDELWLN